MIEVLLALTAESQDTAVREMEVLVNKLAERKVADLRFVGRRQLRSDVEVLTWEATKPETLMVEIVDDGTFPAMYMRLHGVSAIVEQAVELAARSFQIAWPEDCVALAERESAADPSLIMMAALVTDDSFEARLMKVIERAFDSKNRDQREAAARALGIRCTPKGRALLERKAAAERDRDLRRKLEMLLARWPG